MDQNVSSSKRSSREAYLTYEQIQEQTKSKTLKSTVASAIKDDQHFINNKLKNYDTFHDNKTETDSQQNDESESDESIDSWGSFASAIRAQYPDAVLKRSNKKKSPSSISKSRTESSSGIDLRSYYSSATSAQTVNTIHQNYRCKYLILLIAAYLKIIKRLIGSRVVPYLEKLLIRFTFLQLLLLLQNRQQPEVIQRVIHHPTTSRVRL